MSEKYIDLGEKGKYHLDNKLNHLTNKEWIKFQKSWFVLEPLSDDDLTNFNKSWFVLNPKAREDDVLLHPAKFPEELIEQFVKFFTKKGQVVLDPMVGTGSTLVACANCDRSGIGIELLEKYAKIAEKRVNTILSKMRGSNLLRILEEDSEQDARKLLREKEHLFLKVICADARDLDKIDLPEIDYCITSPPYWDMLHAEGFETQRERAESGLDLYYSEDERDLGNIHDYERFLDELVDIYRKVYDVLKEKGYLTVVVKNILKGGRVYPLAWDIGKRLSKIYVLKDEKIWCQDNQKLAPYGYKYAWVSNTMHHYCLNFRKE